MKRRNHDDYLAMLQSLLPKGKMWSRDPDSLQTQILSAEAEEFVRLEERATELFNESVLRQTNELLTEYEADYGLPEAGFELDGTTQERIETLYSKMLEMGQLFAYYIEEQAFLKNYVIYIFEYDPFLVGSTTVGSRIGGLNPFFWEALADAYGFLGPFDNSFSSAFDNSPQKYEVGNIDFLQHQTRSLDVLIEWIKRIKQAHTNAWVDFYNTDFDRAFSWCFKSDPHHDGTIPIKQYGYAFGSGFTSTYYDYDGTYLVGPFDNGFNLAIDAHHGGPFESGSFGLGFQKEN